MHLLAATPGSVDDGKEAVDLEQSPADLVVISAADTELALLSHARRAHSSGISLRLANMMHLMHPMSVDLHLSNCAAQSRMVVVRMLGGAGYWRYGFEQYAAHLQQAGIPFAFLPGDDKPDPELRAISTVSDEDYDALWGYLVEGGIENAQGFLRYCEAMLDGGEKPQAARPLLRSGLYWPNQTAASEATLHEAWHDNGSTVAIVFYRALLQGAGLAPIDMLIEQLQARGLNPLPIFVASLKDPLSQATLNTLFSNSPPDVILNATAFATGSPDGDTGNNPLADTAANDAPVFQIVLSASSEASWSENLSGLSARDIAMNVALPEVDGRVLTRAISFKGEAYFDDETQCPIATYCPQADRIEFVADLTAAWANLRTAPANKRKVGLILANYPNKDGRLANGVGLDTPAATQHVLHLLQNAGYEIEKMPHDSAELMAQIMAGPTNWLTDRQDKSGGEALSLTAYQQHFCALPEALQTAMRDRWGEPEADPFFEPGSQSFKLSIHRFGNAVVGIQPARGYNIDPVDTYHSPDLVPPHNYLAFYMWLRSEFNADAIVHMGKHGNLEWLPGKAVALSRECWPEAILGPVPHIYPFIVNDPGEGTQAKRRASAVIIDHLTPPLTRAESYGPLRDLEALVDEYYEAAGVDPRRIDHLKREILSLSEVSGLGKDAGFNGDSESDLAKLDAYLCDLKEAQIRDGLHIFGQSPTGDQARDLAIALLRIPRSTGKGRDASILRALASDCAIEIDPLDCDMAAPYVGPKHAQLAQFDGIWRSNGDTIERLELLAQQVYDHGAPTGFTATAPVIEELNQRIIPTIQACGPDEGAGILRALNGKFVAPAPSGAPSRGRLDTLPTGRNFFSVDSRAVPTPTAWHLGWKSASLLLEKHLQTHGDWPKSMLITAWGTANMRTGGDDIAQALALMGVKPKWDSANRRVTGFEIIPQTALGRPRVDVTLRISGFFRDAFPQLIALVDSAARAVQALDESDDFNPAAARNRAGETAARVYGSKPGAYGAGLQALIDERIWNEQADFGKSYIEWGGYAYSAGKEGVADHDGFTKRLSQVDAIVQNQDNREHDLLDSDDYYQFEGGAAAAVQMLQGEAKPIYHNDHSRPERPVIRTLEEEIGRVVRSRVVNPKWINGVKRHGYKGAFEIAASVDYLFAFSATTGAVSQHHFDLVEEAILADHDTRDFIADCNPAALQDIADRLQEAIDRNLWSPRSNSARDRIAKIRMTKDH